MISWFSETKQGNWFVFSDWEPWRSKRHTFFLSREIRIYICPLETFSKNILIEINVDIKVYLFDALPVCMIVSSLTCVPQYTEILVEAIATRVQLPSIKAWIHPVWESVSYYQDTSLSLLFFSLPAFCVVVMMKCY